MKRSTERSILLAILLSALIPVLTLGLFTMSAVLRLGRQITENSQRTLQERQRSDLHLRCLEKSEDVAVFLRGRADDLRSLALLPPDPATYRAFYWSTLAPLEATDEGGHTERIWLPLYTALGIVAADGTDLLAVHEGDPVPEAQLGSRPEFVQPPAQTSAGRAGLLARVSVRLLPAPGDTPQSFANPTPHSGGFDGSLELSLPLAATEVRRAGTVWAVLNPRHVAARLRPPTLSPLRPADGPRETRAVFFFRDEAQPLPSAPPAVTCDPPLPAAFSRHMAAATAAVRRGESGVLPAAADGSVGALAYAPILSPVGPGPGEALPSLGGVVIAVESRAPATGQEVTATAAALTYDLRLQIGGLALASVLFVSLAALLVAQRMGRPWRRLQEKARNLAGGDPTDDEVGSINSSFDSLTSRLMADAGRLRASKRRMDEFIEMSPDGIAVTDPRGRILHSNRALCQMTRRTPAELTGKDVRRLWAHPTDWDEMLDRLRVAGRLKSYEGELRRGDGAAFPALLTLRLHGHGDDESIDLIARDISDWKEIQRRDRKKTEALFRVYGELSKAHQQLRSAYAEVEQQVHAKTAELRQACDALQASDRVKTEFLMNMSHELRTPLNCIIGYSEAMVDGLDGPISAEQAGSLERIIESGRRLLRLIENLLDLSRIEAGAMNVVCVETRLEDAVADVVHQASSLVGHRPIHLEVNLDHALPTVWADPDRLRQVLFNLVGNALKFTERGVVRITASPTSTSMVTVTVSDTGPGIPPEQLDLIFQRFVQLPRANSSGAGLGLALCREMVENMGGRIRADSEPGHGSCFTFTLTTVQPSTQLALPFSVASTEHGLPGG